MQWQQEGRGTTAGTVMGADFEALGIPTMEQYIKMYCERTGRTNAPNMDYYMAYNFFRLAGILQGIVGRVRDGTASSANAARDASAVRPLAERAWKFAQRAGAV
jgi:aminoglycoside phosphotransferase (APT) family kinase protein